MTRIVADRDIPHVRYYLEDLGDLILLQARSIDADAVADADVLVVRTVTRVDAALLSGSRVRAVASASSGVDHVDLAYLRERGIRFADALGCNARSVAEYVLSSLFALAGDCGLDFEGARAGIVGCGHAGSRVAAMLEFLGVDCLLNDPPLRASTGESRFRDLSEVIDSEILTLHVPLAAGGEHPTLRMVNAAFLSRVRPDVILINTARGEVVDDRALVRFLDEHEAAAAVLDVWAGEPAVDTDLLARADIATPHIAGYSLDARLRATQTVCRRVREFLGTDGGEPPVPTLPPPHRPVIEVGAGEGTMEALGRVVLASYDARTDSAPLKELVGLAAPERAARFAESRRNYAGRREFPAHTVRLAGRNHDLTQVLERLGFRVEQAD